MHLRSSHPPMIIGIDHGYGNIKTVNTCFKAGVSAYERQPTFQTNLLLYQGRYYQIGEEHKEFSANKMADSDYYILTLAALARELHIRKQNTACVHIAAGLPLTWVNQQKEAFKAYLLQNASVDFTFRGAAYHVEISGADVFPQGFAAVAHRLREFGGVNMVADIGNGTMNVMTIIDRRPQEKQCFTEKYGTYQCMLAAKEQLTRQLGVVVEESIIDRVLRHGTAELDEKYLRIIQATATEYVSGIFRRLREHEYTPDLMKLYVVGGGSCLVKHFGQYDPDRVILNEDICATAKGYEYLARLRAQRGGGPV